MITLAELWFPWLAPVRCRNPALEGCKQRAPGERKRLICGGFHRRKPLPGRAFGGFQYPTPPLSVLPELQRDAAAAIAALVLKSARTGKPVPQI